MEFTGSFLRHHFVGKPVSGFFSGYKCVCCVWYLALSGTACILQFFSIFTLFVREEVKEMMNKRKTGSETLAAFEEHLNEVTFSNLRKQATFHDTFNSSPGKWHPSLEFLCLFLRCHFMGKLLVALQNVGCFFSGQTFKGYRTCKKLEVHLSIGQTALKFSSPTAIAYFVKHFLCLCGYLAPCPLCGQERFRSYIFRSKIYLYEMDETFFKPCTCFQ